jgi:hypothetical protein
VLKTGKNRWQHDLRFDYTQGIFRRLTLDVSGDRIYYGDNTEAGTGRQTRSQDFTFGAYLWLSRDITDALKQTIMPTAVQASLSIGSAGIFGGE